jgi:hypothetical protein
MFRNSSHLEYSPSISIHQATFIDETNNISSVAHLILAAIIHTTQQAKNNVSFACLYAGGLGAHLLAAGFYPRCADRCSIHFLYSTVLMVNLKWLPPLAGATNWIWHYHPIDLSPLSEFSQHAKSPTRTVYKLLTFLAKCVMSDSRFHGTGTKLYRSYIAMQLSDPSL